LAFNPLRAQSLQVNSKIDMMLVRGNYEDVIDTCKQILTNDSLNPEIYYKMGVAYHNILEENLSISSFSRAVNLNPENKVYNFMLAKGYYGTGRFDLAEPLLNKICSIDSLNWLYSYYLTSIHIHNKEYDKAINIYKRFLIIDTTNYNYLNKIAFAYLKKGDYDYATALYNKSLQINKKNLIAIKNLAYLYTVAGNPDKSIQLLSEGIEEDTTDMDLFANRARLYYSMAQQKSSEDAYRKALNDYLVIFSSGDSSVGYLKRAGICYLSTSQFKEALSYLIPAYKSDSTDYQNCSYIGLCYYNLKDFKNSILFYNRVIEILTPVNAQLGMTYRYLAATHKSNGMYKNAIDSYIKAMSFKSDPDIYMEIANLYDEKLNNGKKAIYYYQKYLDNYKSTEFPPPTEYIESINSRVAYLKKNLPE
jgi:tetratricopeptide (TPR) repeat protein